MNKLVIVNPNERHFTRSRFVLAFGAYGAFYCLVWANHVEDALDEAVDYLADHAPGLLADEAVRSEYDRLVGEGLASDEAMARSEVDTTCAGNSGHYLNSWEWGIALENPSRAQLKELVASCEVVVP